MNGEDIIGTFYEKESPKTNHIEFRIEKVIKKQGDKLYVKWNGYDNSFSNWIDNKESIKMSQYSPRLNELSDGNVKVELDLSLCHKRRFKTNSR